ncbi:MAG: tetratricopeptide repeat protein, partial [Gemmatimonadales bacterium]
ALPVRGPAPLAEMLSRFARGIGAVRSGDTAQARAEVARLVEIEARLSGAGGYDWSRIAGIKRQALGAWLALAACDTAAALRDARAAADLEDVTEKHPVTPGELLPARELEGDMLLAVGRYAEAGRVYRSALEREPGRARSVFGAARAAELMGDLAAAREGYRTFLTLMEKADGDRAEIAMARKAVASRE